MRIYILLIFIIFPLPDYAQKRTAIDSQIEVRVSKIIAEKDSISTVTNSPVVEAEELSYDKKVALGVAIISLALGIFNFVKQSSIASDNRDISRIEDAYKKWTDKDFVTARRWVMETLRNKYPQDDNNRYGYYNLKKGEDDDVDKITSVSIFFDYIGLFMHNRLFNQRLFWEFWGESVVRYWEVLSPYLYEQRKLIKERYVTDKVSSIEYLNGSLSASEVEKKAIEQALQYQKHFEDLAILCESYSKEIKIGGKIRRRFNYFSKSELRKRPVDYLD